MSLSTLLTPLTFFIPLCGILLLPFVWYLTSDLLALSNPYILPPLSSVLLALQSQVDSGELIMHGKATLYRCLSGFCIGCFLGVFFGMFVASSKILHRLSECSLEFFRSTPVLAIFPVFLLLFGLGDSSKVAIATFPTTLILALSTITGISHASPLRIRMAKACGASRLQLLCKVLFFEALPEITLGMRVALSLALTVSIASEMFVGTEEGIGQKIFDSYLMGSIDILFAYVLLAGICGYLMNKAFLCIERRVVFWSEQ